jgi:parallel beta-helix repeat protein
MIFLYPPVVLKGLSLLVRKESVMKIIEKMGSAVLVIGFLGLIVPGLEAAEIKVRCDRGHSVQSALDSLTGPATLVVTGTCDENVVIKQDDVTLQGGTFVGPDPNQNTIWVQGARRVVITGVTVSGAGYGVAVSQGGALTLVDSTIQDNAVAGVVVFLGSSATVNACIIQNNTGNGMRITENSTLVLTNSAIQGNGDTGVLVRRSSSARIGRTAMGDPGPNTIQNNAGNGVRVFQNAQSLIDGNTIQNNSGDGIFIDGGSATVTNNTIQSNGFKGIEVSNTGNARIGINDSGSGRGPNMIKSNAYEGIQITNGAAAFMLSNEIESNGLSTGRSGVTIARATGRLVGENVVQGNGNHGIEVNNGGSLFQGKGDFFNLTVGPDIIRGNTRSGVSAFNSGSLDIQNAQIIDNPENGIVLNFHSTLRIFNSTVTGNGWHGIRLNRDSGVLFGDPPIAVTGNVGFFGLSCAGNESSFEGNTSGIVGIEKSCTGF